MPLPFTVVSAKMQIKLRIPESQIEKIIGEDVTFERGLEEVERWIEENEAEALEFAFDSAEVEVDA